MSTPRMVIAEVLSVARKQLEGLTEHPELGTGLPFPAPIIDAAIKRIEETGARRERVKKLVLTLTEQEQKDAFDLRDKVNRNIASVLTRLGKYAPELLSMGAAPLTGTHPASKPEAPPTGPASAAGAPTK